MIELPPYRVSYRAFRRYCSGKHPRLWPAGRYLSCPILFSGICWASHSWTSTFVQSSSDARLLYLIYVVGAAFVFLGLLTSLHNPKSEMVKGLALASCLAISYFWLVATGEQASRLEKASDALNEAKGKEDIAKRQYDIDLGQVNSKLQEVERVVAIVAKSSRTDKWNIALNEIRKLQDKPYVAQVNYGNLRQRTLDLARSLDLMRRDWVAMSGAAGGNDESRRNYYNVHISEGYLEGGDGSFDSQVTRIVAEYGSFDLADPTLDSILESVRSMKADERRLGTLGVKYPLPVVGEGVVNGITEGLINLAGQISPLSSSEFLMFQYGRAYQFHQRTPK